VLAAIELNRVCAIHSFNSEHGKARFRPLAGATTVNIQQQVHLVCTAGTCTGNFPALTAKQRLRLQKVVCFVSGSVNGQKAIEAYVKYTSPLFYFDLAQRSHVSNTLAFDDLFDQDAAFDVPKGKTLQATVRYSGSGVPGTYCTIYGQRITSP
jgi:hypothetical protein